MRGLILRLPRVEFNLSPPHRANQHQAPFVSGNADALGEAQQAGTSDTRACLFGYFPSQRLLERFIAFRPAAGRAPGHAVGADEHHVAGWG
jgi:hypothetical protein